jgi:hypothetical protein
MVIPGVIRIAAKIVLALGMPLIVSSCVAAGIGALAAGGALGVASGATTQPHPAPPAHASPPARTDHSPTPIPATPNY